MGKPERCPVRRGVFIITHMMSAIFGRNIVASVDYGRPSGALSHVAPTHRGLAPPANGGRPSGAVASRAPLGSPGLLAPARRPAPEDWVAQAKSRGGQE